ncbi:MAG: hypothetical protein ACRES7_02335 [Gammaproteobacteria bacterium]
MNMQTLKISRFLGFAVAGVALACVMSGAFAAGTADQDADMQAVNNFRLNDKVIAEYSAALENLIALQKQHPEVTKQMDKESDSENNPTIAQVVAMINEYPLARDAITRTSMSVNDFILCGFVVLQTGMRAMSLGQGASASSVPSGVPTDNLHYYQSNKAKFDALSKLTAQMNSDSGQ